MPLVYDTPVPYSKEETWQTDTDTRYTIYYYDFLNFQELMKYKFPKMSKIRRWLTRGFTDGEYIYALNSSHWYSKIGHDRLIRHEIGHIEGFKHRWWIPDVMHPSWLFRWSDKVWIKN
jgi:hypothetical protein